MKIREISALNGGDQGDDIADKIMLYVKDVDFTCIDDFLEEEDRLKCRAAYELGLDMSEQVYLAVEWKENPDIPDLAEFMQEYELETYQQVIDVLEDGEVLGTLPLVQNQVEELWFEASEAVRVKLNFHVTYFRTPSEERITPQDHMWEEDVFTNYHEAEKRATSLEQSTAAHDVKISIWHDDCCIDEMV